MSDSNKAITILGFDFGVKRIGVAVGQTITGTASPLNSIPARDGIPDKQALQRLLQEWHANVYVIGLPLNMDGSLSEMALRAKKFGNRLHGQYGKPIYFVDERLSTYEAKTIHQQQAGSHDYKNDPVDSLSARLLVESWLRDR